MEYVDSTSEEVIGEPFSETPWWDGEIRSRIREFVDRAAEGEYVSYEADLTTPEEDQYSVAGMIRPVTDDADHVVSLIISTRDITARKEHQSEPQKREQTIDALHRTTRELIAADSEDEIADIITDTAAGLLGLPHTAEAFVEFDPEQDQIELHPLGDPLRRRRSGSVRVVNTLLGKVTTLPCKPSERSYIAKRRSFFRQCDGTP